MKKLLTIAFFITSGFYFTACQQDMSSANMMPMKTTPTAAHPAIAYTGTSVSHGSTFYHLSVMDTDGTHQGNVYTSTASSENLNVRPSWSPSGGSLAFFSHNGPDGSCIKSVDISQSNGVPVGSNVHVVYTDANLYGSATVAWSAVAATAKIAFITRPTGTTSTAKIQTVSTSGGTPTVLYSSPAGETHLYKSVTWSNDDSKIAFIDRNGADNVAATDIVRVIDATTGTELETITIPASIYKVNSIDWSRTGIDNLALDVNVTSGGASTLYYLTPTTGSTPTTDGVTGAGASWSPNNSSILTWNVGTSTSQKTVANTNTTSNVVAGPGYYGTWKR